MIRAGILIVVAALVLAACSSEEGDEPTTETPTPEATDTTAPVDDTVEPTEEATAEATEQPTEEPTSEPTPEPTDTPAASSRCEDVHPVTIDLLTRHITIDSEGELVGAQAVRSESFDAVWFVAAELDWPGLEGEGDVAVWAVAGPLDEPGAALSIDGFAKQFSDWFHGEDTSFNVTRNDDGFDEAIECHEAVS